MATVAQYDLQWTPAANTGAIYLKLDDGRSSKVPVNSAAEFIAVALILDKAPVTLRDDGTLEYKS
jgi:hypothetical protein